MATSEIARAEWQAFLECFSRQHQGWLVSIELLAQESGAQVTIGGLELEDLRYDGLEGAHDTMVIAVRTPQRGHATYRLAAPAAVLVKETAEQVEEALEVVAADGRTLLLHFSSALPPEMVADIAY